MNLDERRKIREDLRKEIAVEIEKRCRHSKIIRHVAYDFGWDECKAKAIEIILDDSDLYLLGVHDIVLEKVNREIDDDDDDHTYTWGGAGPDCSTVRREAAL